MRVQVGLRLVGILSCLTIGLMLAGCVSPGQSLSKLSSAGLAEPAKDICTKSGSTPLPLNGSTRVVAAANSTVGEVRPLVESLFDGDFNGQLGKLPDKTRVAVCFVVTDARDVPNGRMVVVQLPEQSGSAFIANNW